VPSTSASAPRRKGPSCSIRARAEVCEGVTSSLAERDRDRNWREILVSATSNPAASCTAPSGEAWAVVPKEILFEALTTASIYLVVSN
jgi:hypothetical protein